MGEKLTRTQQKNLEKFGGVNPADEPFSRRQFASAGRRLRPRGRRGAWPAASRSATDGAWKGSSRRRRCG